MLRMGDGPVANLPPGLEAYAGYIDNSGIGVTFADVYARYPNAQHLSISVHGNPAMCGDVENGALSSWAGYDYGYCSVSQVNRLIALYGRPRKLWTAHDDPLIGAHICSPQCWPGLVTTADGTQHASHGGLWDESLLDDHFFDLPPAPPAVPPLEDMDMIVRRQSDGACVCIAGSYRFAVLAATDLQAAETAGIPIWNVSDKTYASMQAAHL